MLPNHTSFSPITLGAQADLLGNPKTRNNSEALSKLFDTATKTENLTRIIFKSRKSASREVDSAQLPKLETRGLQGAPSHIEFAHSANVETHLRSAQDI